MAGVKLGALNDWLDGSQECIQPLLTGKSSSSSSLKVSTSNASNARGVRDFSRGIATEKADLIKTRPAAPSSSSTSAQGATTSSSGRKTKAEVAVSDCLACSGCVTSAEAVVLETPGFDQFLEMLGNKNGEHHVVVSVSPESLVNLHLRWNQHGTLVETLGKLESLFMFYASVPVTVTDCGIAHAVYLRERGTGNKQRPVVASYCPGWTRYAEKVAPPGIAPYLSAVRNPLVIQGHLAKTLLKKCEFLKWYRSCFRFSMPSISNHFDFKEPPRNEKIKVDVDDEADPVLNAQRAVFAALEVRPVFDVAGFPLTAVRKHLGVDEALRLLAREDYFPLLRPTDPLLAQAGPWMRASGYRHIQNVITRLTAISAAGRMTAISAAGANRADRLNAGAGVEQEPEEGVVERKRKMSTGQEQVRRNKNENSLGFVDVAACPGGCLNGGAQMRVAGGLPAMQAFWAEQPLFGGSSENHHDQTFIADETYETGGQIHYYSFRRVDGGDQEIGGAGVVIAGDGEQKNDLLLARGKAAPTLNW
eukprot:g3649.t1